MRGHLKLNSWAGRSDIRVTILRETPKKYLVKFIDHARIRDRAYKPGETRLVPKDAITLEPKLCYDYTECHYDE